MAGPEVAVVRLLDLKLHIDVVLRLRGHGFNDRDLADLASHERHRVAHLGPIHRGVLHLGRIHDREAAGAGHLERVVGADEGGRVLVEPDAVGERIGGESGEQAAQPVALLEVLVHDHPVREPEPGSQRDHARARRGSLVAVGDHVLGQERRTCRGAGDVHAACVHGAQRLGHGCAAERGAQPELAAAGEEHAVRLLQHRQLLEIFTLLPGLEGKHPHLAGLETSEQLLVAPAGGAQLGGRRDDRDPGLALAAQPHEALEDRFGADFVFGASDRNDETTLLAVGHARWGHGASSLTQVSDCTSEIVNESFMRLESRPSAARSLGDRVSRNTTMAQSVQTGQGDRGP